VCLDQRGRELDRVLERLPGRVKVAGGVARVAKVDECGNVAWFDRERLIEPRKRLGGAASFAKRLAEVDERTDIARMERERGLECCDRDVEPARLDQRGSEIVVDRRVL
jgi:hypothetical protein